MPNGESIMVFGFNHNQIFWSIIIFYAIKMMNMFRLCYLPFVFHFCYKYVFANISILPCSVVIWLVNHYVAFFACSLSPLPARVFFSEKVLALPSALTGWGAEMVLCFLDTTGISLKLSAALRAWHGSFAASPMVVFIASKFALLKLSTRELLVGVILLPFTFTGSVTEICLKYLVSVPLDRITAIVTFNCK